MPSDFFNYGPLDWRLNCSFITLISKKEDSCTPKDFRLLNLIESAYKIISKLLAERLKSVMPILISDFQGAFISDKQILDGAFIANEGVNNILKYKKPGSAERFKPTKGLRKGDSISSYLFLLVVEILSMLMNYAVETGQIHGFEVAETGNVISHLQFADDILIFLDATSDEVTKIFIILFIFETLTGMKLKLEISVGVDEVVEVLAKELGYKTEKLPIKYLDLPIGASSRNTSVWDYVLERMEMKLATWKRKYLNKAGRLVLIKNYLSSLPIYFLSLFHLPVIVEKKMIALMRNFLWGYV
ncbi:uncharacterized protein LOC113351689 [Papaver somniferum]|uniref:uncharacterized protein LOC113351689 n=1 Tax=Papaver somniferum TaxID=3469 RepID=UPI000E6FD3F2|nr:uncharacterized protein LOC113351689 [Papaver somniferum]